MKFSIPLLVFFLAIYCSAYKEETPKWYLPSMRKGESEGDFHNRIIKSSNYSLPVGECLFDNQYDMKGQWCVAHIDSCCFKKYGWICIPFDGPTANGEGKCYRYREEEDGPTKKFFNHTI
ncbi:hypothetical protein HDE_05244 [Halotydeus destructor]|nr:hypothetical protein HDE_05244 [Halotydeus destructor]